MTTLEDLKRAIDAVPTRPGPIAHPSHQPTPNWWLEEAAVWNARRADAWRAAFEWRDSIPAGGRTKEYLKGMELIREKLK